ncbi:MAG TPA: Stp1/IreP family PP2C-type Ser/Thr phosphatase [Conexibacter sp.]|jgi:serine/threonine protein phosphatase PrpC|nr:Stp1/IreP family PP2C-type Ser/Thr phosphatase [Conexibacter sp.]
MLRVAEHFEKSDTGRQRRANEDSFFVRAPLFVVADGMGGAQAGEVASRLAAETFASGLPDDGTSEERLETRVRDANRRIHEISQEDRALNGMGTTITAAYLDADELALAHVGDSRAYLLRDGELTRLTRDHTLVEELVRRGELTEQEAAEHPQRSIITRALGPEPDVDIDLHTHRVQDGDVLLLCSDGLTSMVPEPEVAGILRGASGLGAAGRALVAAANDAGGRDNITVVLFRIEELAAGGVAAAAAATADETEELTRAGATALRTEDVREAVAAAGGAAAASHADRAGGAGEDDSRDPARENRLAPRQDPPATAPAPPRVVPPRGSRERAHAPLPRRVKLLAATVATVIVVAGLGVAGWLASRAVFFVGTDASGMVTVYRGLPWDLPVGIRLYEQYYVSGVPAGEVPAARRGTLLDHRLRSRDDVRSLISELELGQLAR